MSLYYYKHQFVPLDRTLELYFSGCTMKCEGCHNQFLQERNESNTKVVTVDDIIHEIKDYTNITSQVHIVGGEPLEQDLRELKLLLQRMKILGFHDIILFTGKTLSEEFIKENMDLFQYCDYLKIGHYDISQLNLEKTLIPDAPGFPLASKNQRFIKIK